MAHWRAPSDDAADQRSDRWVYFCIGILVGFIIAFSVGIAACYLIAPAPKVVVKFPSPTNAGKVVYQDGSLSSNRKVPGNLVGTYEGDAPALAFIEAQDRDIAEKSGRPRGPIKRIERVR
jgi:hypothetical protein